MQWTDRYSTGIEQIDGHHRMLFKMSEDYREALEAGEGSKVYGLMLESLYEYAKGHFGLEEHCMYRYRCPAADTNSQAHQHFLTTLDRFRQRFDARGFAREDARALVDYVDGWLANHIGRIDTQLKPCIGGAPR